MKIFRSILPVILLLVTTLLVSCGGPTASAPPTYTPEKLEQIKTYRISVDKARERMSADFFIGAHAMTQSDCLLTRERGFYSRYFTTRLPDGQRHAVEHDRYFLNTAPEGEPQLGRRGLYDLPLAGDELQRVRLALLWVLNLSDGSWSLEDIAARAQVPLESIVTATEALRGAGLLEPA